MKNLILFSFLWVVVISQFTMLSAQTDSKKGNAYTFTSTGHAANDLHLELSEDANPIVKKKMHDRHLPFCATAGFSAPIGNPDNYIIPTLAIENSAFAPGTFEQIFERLDAEFLIGTPSGEKLPEYEMAGRSEIAPALRLGARLGNRFELRAGGQYFRSKWTGFFPVTVFPTHSNPQETIQGTLSAFSSGVIAETDLACFLTKGIVRPFISLGVRGQFPLKNETAATIADVPLALETKPVSTGFSPFGGAGIRVAFLKNGILDAGATYAKIPGGGYIPSVQMGLGWQFGTSHHNGAGTNNEPELISINNDKCECIGSNVTLKTMATVTTRPRPKDPVVQAHTFDTKDTKSSAFTHEIKVAEGDKVSLAFDDPVIACQLCQLGDCLPITKEMTIKVIGLTPFPVLDDKVKPVKDDKSGKAKTTQEKTLAADKIKDGLKDIPVLAGTGDVRLEIAIKYRCGKDKPGKEACKQSLDCTISFVVILKRES
jgi:hypothetical protein